MVDEILQVKRSNVLKTIKEAQCDDVVQVLETLFPELVEVNLNEFKQIQIAITSKGNKNNWNGYIGTATKGELSLLNPTLFGEDSSSQCIVIAIPQGVGKRAGKNVKELLVRTTALTLHGNMDKDGGDY